MAVHHDWLTQSRQETRLSSTAEAADFAVREHVHREQDRRRICGYPPTYTLTHCRSHSSGRLLHYDQWYPQGTRASVSPAWRFIDSEDASVADPDIASISSAWAATGLPASPARRELLQNADVLLGSEQALACPNFERAVLLRSGCRPTAASRGHYSHKRLVLAGRD